MQDTIIKTAHNPTEKFSLVLHRYEDEKECRFYFMERRGFGFGVVVSFKDDPSYVVLQELSVHPEFRNNGLGDFIQETRIGMFKDSEVEEVYLWVKKDSWMREWYERKGFIYHSDHQKITDSVWMHKSIKNK